MIIHVQYITVTLHSSISRKDPIFFSFTQTMLAGWQYIIIQYTIQVYMSRPVKTGSYSTFWKKMAQKNFEE